MIRHNLIEVIEDVLEVREEIVNAARVLIGMKNSIYGQEPEFGSLSSTTTF